MGIAVVVVCGTGLLELLLRAGRDWFELLLLRAGRDRMLLV